MEHYYRLTFQDVTGAHLTNLRQPRLVGVFVEFMPQYLSKSDFKVAQTCSTKLYYKKLGYPSNQDGDEYLEFLADGGYMVETIAKLLHPEGIEIGWNQDPEHSALETTRALQTENVTLFEATLLSGTKLARVDILRKNGNRFDLIEVKSKSVKATEGPPFFRSNKGKIIVDWVPYLEDVAYQTHLLRELFYEPTVPCRLFWA